VVVRLVRARGGGVPLEGYGLELARPRLQSARVPPAAARACAWLSQPRRSPPPRQLCRRTLMLLGGSEAHARLPLPHARVRGCCCRRTFLRPEPRIWSHIPLSLVTSTARPLHALRFGFWVDPERYPSRLLAFCARQILLDLPRIEQS
jgi:hypothetical protein